MAYFKITDRTSQLQDLRYKGRTWGKATGLAPLDEIYSIQLGYPLFIAGAAHSAKTELTMEVMVNTMFFYNWKWCCKFGEGGEVEEIYADLCHKLIGKPYRAGDDFSMTESEKSFCEQFFEKHLILIDDEKDYTLREFYDEVSEIEKRTGIKFNGTVFDPFNDAVDCSKDFGGREDKWLSSELKMVRKVSKKNNRIDVLVTHIGDIKPVTDKDTGFRYTPPALPTEWAGGRTWHRRGFVMISTFIPPKWLKDENGREYGENVSIITIQKAKPKGIAKLGSCILYWDWKRNKYCWYKDGQAQFAYDINEKPEPKKLSASTDFDINKTIESNKEETLPF